MGCFQVSAGGMKATMLVTLLWGLTGAAARRSRGVFQDEEDLCESEHLAQNKIKIERVSRVICLHSVKQLNSLNCNLQVFSMIKIYLAGLFYHGYLKPL